MPCWKSVRSEREQRKVSQWEDWLWPQNGRTDSRRNWSTRFQSSKTEDTGRYTFWIFSSRKGTFFKIITLFTLSWYWIVHLSVEMKVTVSFPHPKMCGSSHECLGIFQCFVFLWWGFYVFYETFFMLFYNSQTFKLFWLRVNSASLPWSSVWPAFVPLVWNLGKHTTYKQNSLILPQAFLSL